MYTIIFFILGACLGSFIPCYAERRQKALSQKGRSYCMNCKHTIFKRDLIPIFGYFLCGGHCRHCGAAIPKVFPFIEGLSAFIAAFLFLAATSLAHGFLLLAGYALLLLLSLDDWYSNTIHDLDLLLYFIIFFLDSMLFGHHSWLNQLIGALIIALPLFIITILRPHALGSGDVLFMAISGFYLGIPDITYAFCLGIFIALAYAMYLLMCKKATRNTALPLIPFLSIGVFITIIWPLAGHFIRTFI